MDLLLREESIVLRKKRVDHFDIIDKKLVQFVESNLSASTPEQLYWNSGSKINNLAATLSEYTGVADLRRLNSFKRINKYFESVNQSMEMGSFFVTAVETKGTRKKKIYNKYPVGIRQLSYGFDFLLHRCFAKLNKTKELYFKLTNGRNRALSLTECLGRLVSCGFEIIGYKKIGSITYIMSRKVSEPVYDMQPTYGLFCKLNRVGYKGRMITVYKLRTMHPYSEYLQEYLYNSNGTHNGDKINGDFRVTNWGKIFRRFWIDELPMLLNYLKGEIKLVGVRPLSRHKFDTYPEELQEKRISVKPGLVPPFYADMPETVEEFYKTEERYLDQYLKNPLWTDFKYFFKAMYNIFIRNARSL
jgi:lipopolysaccharide/colanic/teichoic acid biosynthesis glycosyltransferase